MKCVKVASALSEPIGKMQGFMYKIQEGAANGQIMQKRSTQERDDKIFLCLPNIFLQQEAHTS